MAVTTVQLTTLLQGLGYNETVWNAFFCLFVKHLFNVPGSRGILVNNRHKLVL